MGDLDQLISMAEKLANEGKWNNEDVEVNYPPIYLPAQAATRALNL